MLARNLDRALQWIVILLMVTLTAVVIAGVLFRKFGNSLVWYDEVASILLAWVTYYGAAFAALRRGHIGVDGLLLKLPLRLRYAAVAVAEVLVIGFFTLLAWAGYRVIESLEGDSMVSLPWVPVTLTQSVIPIGAALFILCELVSLPRYLESVRRGRSVGHDPEPPTQPPVEPPGGSGGSPGAPSDAPKTGRAGGPPVTTPDSVVGRA
jgi:TRAP-type C4-dicarboxylate transport system permease small subunit